MIVYCSGTYGERVDQTMECIRRVRGHLDRIVIIVDQTVCENDRQRLRDMGAEVHYRKWNDHFPEMRNYYLNLCKTNDWICVSDPDEWFGEKLCQDFRALTTECNKRGFTSLLVNSHDIWHNNDGSVRDKLKSTFYKKLIFKKLPGARYNGVGISGSVHEHLSIPNEVEHRIEDKYFYEHHKFDHEVWERAMRNVFIGGGGNNRGHENKSWRKLREIASSIGINDWTTMRDYMKKGNVDQRLKQWLIDNRNDGMDYEHEMMEGFKWYFVYLHPNENTGNHTAGDLTENNKAELMRFIEGEYLRVLGRHADQAGKEFYCSQIMGGVYDRYTLDGILRNSEEFKRKFGK